MGDSWDFEHLGPNITFNRVEQFHSQHSHSILEAGMLKIIVELGTKEPEKSLIMSQMVTKQGRFLMTNCYWSSVSYFSHYRIS